MRDDQYEDIRDDREEDIALRHQATLDRDDGHDMHQPGTVYRYGKAEQS